MTNREKLAAYTLEISPLPEEDGGGYQVLYPLLARSVVGYGETPQDAVEDLTSSLDLFLASIEEGGVQLPASPVRPDWQDFSGRVTLRLPKALHFRLDRLAESQGVSLNSLMSDILQSAATALEAGIVFGAVPPAKGQPSRLREQVA